MNQTLTIRRETPADHAQVEALIRRAFWNLYVPGCSEHYLAHIIRPHPDFIPELDLVAELDGRIVGSIMYTHARLVAEDGSEKPILTFGPVCIHPDVQRRGWGKQLIEASFQRALELGYDTVVIFGDPGNYVGRGFRQLPPLRRHAGGRQLPRRHAGKGADPRRAGGKTLGLLPKPRL